VKRRAKFALKLILSLGAAGALLHAAFRGVDLSEVVTAVRTAKVSWLILALLVLLASNLVRAWRWHLLLDPITSPPSIWRTFESILIGYAASNVVPRSGEVARAGALRRWVNAPLSSLFATVLVERVLDLLALLVIFGPVWLALQADITAAFPWMRGVSIVALVGAVGVMGSIIILALYGERAAGVIRRIVGRFSESAADRVQSLLRDFFQGMQAMVRPAAYLEIAGSTLFIFFTYVIITYATFVSFSFQTRYGLDFNAAMVVMVISTIGVILPTTPGGAGTYHFFCSQAMFHLYHVPLPESLAFATVLHALGYVGFTICGGPGLVLLLVKGKQGPVLTASESELQEETVVE